MKIKYKSKKSYITVVVSLLILTLIIGSNLQVLAKKEQKLNTTSYPLSYSIINDDYEFISHPEIDELIDQDPTLGIELVHPNNVKKSSYKGEFLKNYKVLEFSYSDDSVENQEDPYSILADIVFVDASNSSSALNLFERFYLTKYGVGNLIELKQSEKNGCDVIQSLFETYQKDDDGTYYNLFTVFKKDNLGWIIISRFKDKNLKDDLSNRMNKSDLRVYSNIVKSFKNLPSADKNIFTKLPDKVPDFIIQESKKTNGGFPSTF